MAVYYLSRLISFSSLLDAKITLNVVINLTKVSTLSSAYAYFDAILAISSPNI